MHVYGGRIQRDTPYMYVMSKQTDLPLSEKISLLKKIRSQPRGTSHRRLSELLGVPKSALIKLIKEETVLTQRQTEEQAKPVGLGKRKRDGKDPEVEEALTQWFATVLAKSVRISGRILKAKAKEFAQRFAPYSFYKSGGSRCGSREPLFCTLINYS